MIRHRAVVSQDVSGCGTRTSGTHNPSVGRDESSTGIMSQLKSGIGPSTFAIYKEAERMKTWNSYTSFIDIVIESYYLACSAQDYQDF